MLEINPIRRGHSRTHPPRYESFVLLYGNIPIKRASTSLTSFTRKKKSFRPGAENLKYECRETTTTTGKKKFVVIIVIINFYFCVLKNRFRVNPFTSSLPSPSPTKKKIINRFIENRMAND